MSNPEVTKKDLRFISKMYLGRYIYINLCKKKKTLKTNVCIFVFWKESQQKKRIAEQIIGSHFLRPLGGVWFHLPRDSSAAQILLSKYFLSQFEEFHRRADGGRLRSAIIPTLKWGSKELQAHSDMEWPKYGPPHWVYTKANISAGVERGLSIVFNEPGCICHLVHAGESQSFMRY